MQYPLKENDKGNLKLKIRNTIIPINIDIYIHNFCCQLGKKGSTLDGHIPQVQRISPNLYIISIIYTNDSLLFLFNYNPNNFTRILLASHHHHVTQRMKRMNQNPSIQPFLFLYICKYDDSLL